MRPSANLRPEQAAKKLLREGRTAALATLMPKSGDPYCSLVNMASAPDGSPLLLISTLALHTKNILADARVSLMLHECTPGDPLEAGRVMLMGTASLTEDLHARRRYLDRQPEARKFAELGDFGFYKVQLKDAHLVAGFGLIVDLKPHHLLTDLSGADALVEAEPDIVSHLNRDHAEAVRLYAVKLLGAQDGAWLCVGCDPEGLELQLGRTALRLPFPERITAPAVLAQMLKRLAADARGQA